MNNYLQYLIESSFCMILFYVIYKLMLNRETFFQINRFYLISALVLSILIPFLRFDRISVEVPAYYTETLNEINVFAMKQSNPQPIGIDIGQIILYLYIAGVVVFFSRFVISMIRIFILISRSEVGKQGEHKIVLMDSSKGSFSFLNYIFIDKNVYQSIDAEQIIIHEKAHIRFRNSFDILFLEFLSIIYWFNPILRYYKKSLIEVHEYQADSEVLNNGHSLTSYQNTLLNHFLLSDTAYYANHFNNSIIKLRFKMMTKMKSRLASAWKSLVIIPIAALLIFIFSCNKSTGVDSGSFDKARYDKIESMHIVPDQFPDFVGGWKLMSEYIDKNFKTPAEAKGINGKVHVAFIVEEDGTLTNVHIANAKLVKDDNYVAKFGNGCDEEAIRVVKSMPKWKPAIQNGKAIAMTRFIPIVIGDKEIVYKDERANSTEYIYEDTKGIDGPKELNEPVFGAENGNLKAFIQKNIRYPEEARKNGIMGKVLISFDIDEKGQTSNINVVDSVGGGCTEEALRLVKMFPNWKPAEVKGKPVKVKQTLPFMFRLE